jgi:prepilin-type processing-associated H-X9-DG protein
MSGVEDSRNLVAASLPRSDPRAGIFGYDQTARSDEITDGAGNTILLISAGKIIGPWASGGGATIRAARAPYFDSITGFGTAGDPGGAMVAMADGSVKRISKDIDPAVFRALCTIHGGEKVDLSANANVIRRQ